MEVIAPVGIPRVRASTLAPRLDTVQGKRIALLDNSKVNCTPLLDQVQQRLAELGGVPLHSGAEDMRLRVEREMARWKRVIETRNIERQ